MSALVEAFLLCLAAAHCIKGASAAIGSQKGVEEAAKRLATEHFKQKHWESVGAVHLSSAWERTLHSTHVSHKIEKAESTFKKLKLHHDDTRETVHHVKISNVSISRAVKNNSVALSRTSNAETGASRAGKELLGNVVSFITPSHSMTSERVTAPSKARKKFLKNVASSASSHSKTSETAVLLSDRANLKSEQASKWNENPLPKWVGGQKSSKILGSHTTSGSKNIRKAPGLLGAANDSKRSSSFPFTGSKRSKYSTTLAADDSGGKSVVFHTVRQNNLRKTTPRAKSSSLQTFSSQGAEELRTTRVKRYVLHQKRTAAIGVKSLTKTFVKITNTTNRQSITKTRTSHSNFTNKTSVNKLSEYLNSFTSNGRGVANRFYELKNKNIKIHWTTSGGWPKIRSSKNATSSKNKSGVVHQSGKDKVTSSKHSTQSTKTTRVVHLREKNHVRSSKNPTQSTKALRVIHWKGHNEVRYSNTSVETKKTSRVAHWSVKEKVTSSNNRTRTKKISPVVHSIDKNEVRPSKTSTRRNASHVVHWTEKNKVRSSKLSRQSNKTTRVVHRRKKNKASTFTNGTNIKATKPGKNYVPNKLHHSTRRTVLSQALKEAAVTTRKGVNTSRTRQGIDTTRESRQVCRRNRPRKQKGTKNDRTKHKRRKGARTKQAKIKRPEIKGSVRAKRKKFLKNTVRPSTPPPRSGGSSVSRPTASQRKPSKPASVNHQSRRKHRIWRQCNSGSAPRRPQASQVVGGGLVWFPAASCAAPQSDGSIGDVSKCLHKQIGFVHRYRVPMTTLHSTTKDYPPRSCVSYVPCSQLKPQHTRDLLNDGNIVSGLSLDRLGFVNPGGYRFKLVPLTGKLMLVGIPFHRRARSLCRLDAPSMAVLFPDRGPLDSNMGSRHLGKVCGKLDFYAKTKPESLHWGFPTLPVRTVPVAVRVPLEDTQNVAPVLPIARESAEAFTFRVFTEPLALYPGVHVDYKEGYDNFLEPVMFVTKPLEAASRSDVELVDEPVVETVAETSKETSLTEDGVHGVEATDLEDFNDYAQRGRLYLSTVARSGVPVHASVPANTGASRIYGHTSKVKVADYEEYLSYVDLDSSVDVVKPVFGVTDNVFLFPGPPLRALRALE